MALREPGDQTAVLTAPDASRDLAHSIDVAQASPDGALLLNPPVCRMQERIQHDTSDLLQTHRLVKLIGFLKFLLKPL